MFTVRKLFLALSALSIALLFSSLLGMRYLWVYPDEVQDYIQQQQHDLNNITTTLFMLHTELLYGVNQYANSDFVRDLFLRPQAPSTFGINIDAWQLNGIAVVSADLTMVKLQLPQDKKFGFEFNEPQYNRWLADNRGNSDFFSHSSTKEITRFDQTAMLVAQSPIYADDSREEIIGHLIFFKDLDDQLFNYFEYITYFKITEIPTSTDYPNLFLPLTEASPQQHACLLSLNQQPIQCYALDYTGSALPVFLEWKTMLSYFIGVSIPVFFFAIFIYQIMSPLRDALLLLNKNKKERLLRPLPTNRRLYIAEITQLRTAYNHAVAIANNQRQELERLSNTDRLTDISNRRAFDSLLTSTWNRIVRHKQSVALMMVDIDYFKKYNDYYGHQVGDQALQKVAKTLASCARRSDELAARFGGEEFALIVYLNDHHDLEHFQQHLFDEIRKLKIPHEKSTVSQHLTISAGIAWIKDSGQWLKSYTPEQWLSTADMALYKAKQAGRNTYRIEYVFELAPFDLEALQQPVAELDKEEEEGTKSLNEEQRAEHIKS